MNREPGFRSIRVRTQRQQRSRRSSAFGRLSGRPAARPIPLVPASSPAHEICLLFETDPAEPSRRRLDNLARLIRVRPRPIAFPRTNVRPLRRALARAFEPPIEPINPGLPSAGDHLPSCASRRGTAEIDLGPNPGRQIGNPPLTVSLIAASSASSFFPKCAASGLRGVRFPPCRIPIA